MMNNRTVPIAIVGIACRFPGTVNDPQSFWDIVRGKIDCIGPIPDDRWDSRLLDGFSVTPETQFARVGGFVNDIDRFDSAFFGISPREAAEIDPQQRMLLEMSWRCMEDAAAGAEILAMNRTGVYVGVINHDFERLILADRSSINAYSGLGRSTSIAANRISYCFNLVGPSITLDTACSSSLTAIDSACRALASDTVDYAFAGGANAILSPESYIEFSQAAMLSKSGRCHAFDRKADGFVRAEGGGMVLLKRLSDALVDNDRIYASIIATSVNQDGKTVGIMAPNPDSQQAMMRDALSQCGISALDIGYVEAHGTGTQLGDTVEAEALGKIYGHPNLSVGSVKTNIGHTEAAAGIAGLIKATLAVHHGEIPPNLHFSSPNPNIDFESLGISIPTDSANWHNTKGRPRIAAVNSFGFGGANAHAIIQQAPTQLPVSKTTSGNAVLFPVSAGSPQSLESRMTSVCDLLNEASTELECLGFTASRIPRQKIRAAIAVSVEHSNQEQIDFFQGPVPQPTIANDSDRNIAFVFSGIGMQWNGQGSQLYASEPMFRTTVDLCDSLFDKQLKVREAFSTATKFNSDDLVMAHAVHFTLQLALSKLWNSWGVSPSSVIGHSMGEIAAACVGGYISLPDAVYLVHERASHLQPFVNKGLMLAAALGPEKAIEITKDYPEQIVLAAINSAQSVTFSGNSDGILTLADNLSKDGVFNRILEVPVPFHSPIIEDARVSLSALSEPVSNQRNETDWYSSATGSLIANEYKNPEFWWQNFFAPVMFADCLHSAMDSGSRQFLEIGPHANLNYNIHECFKEKELASSEAVYSIHRDRSENATMRAAAAALFCRGIELKFQHINPKGRICSFPKIEFERQSHWKPRTTVQVPDRQPHGSRFCMLEAPATGNPASWSFPLKIGEWTWLKTHRLHGEMIFPAAGYVEAALEAANSCLGCQSIELKPIRFTKLLKLSAPEEIKLEIKTQANGKFHQFNITSHSLHVDSSNTTYSRGHFSSGQKLRPEISTSEFDNKQSTIITSDIVYEQLNEWNFEGDTSRWQILEICRTGENELFVKLKTKFKISDSAQRYLLDPSLLDLCFRCVLGIAKSSQVLLPYEIERLQYWNDTPDEACCQIQLISNNSETLKLNMVIANASGQVIARISNLRLRRFDPDKYRASKPERAMFTIEREWKIHRRAFGDERLFDCSASEIRQNLESYSNTLTRTHQRSNHYEKALPTLTEITSAYIGQALVEANLLQNTSQYSVEELESRCQVVKEQQSLFRSLLTLLADCGYLELIQQEGNGGTQTTLVRRLKEINSDPSLSISNFLKIPESSEYTAELILIDRCGTNLLSVLTGKQTGLDTLFPDTSTDLLKNLYQSSPTCQIYNELLQRSVEFLLDSWSFARPCRILEVGAGTGAVLFHLAPVLQVNEVEYTFTDISSLFVRRAISRFGHLEYARFAELDFDSDPFAQGFGLNQFDIILASDALHLAYSPEQVLHSLSNLLHPGGFLNFIELTNEPTWARLVFGMLRDWWPKDTTNRSAVSPCLSRSEWLQLLSESNYENICALSDRDSGAGLHTVFVSRKGKDKPGYVSNTRNETRERLIFCDSDEFSMRFVERFEVENTCHVLPGDQFTSNVRNYVIDPERPEHYRELIKELRNNGQLPEEIIFLWNFSSAHSINLTVEQQLAASPVLAAAYLIQALDNQGLTPKALALITSNAHRINNQLSLTDFLNAALLGFARTLRNEYPGLDTKLIDVDVSQDSKGESLFEFLNSKSDLTEVCLRGSSQYISAENKLDAESLTTTRPACLMLSSIRPGDLQSLQYRPKALPTPSNTDVVIEVSAASLNFRDVMVALDALPEKSVSDGYMQRSLGFECGGTIVATGNSVRGLQLGDRVVALAKNSFASTVVADQNFVRKIPENCRIDACASLPTAYVTALYCLEKMIKIKSTDRILIHCASGGVGLALVNLAKKIGATICATAGTTNKKRYLNLIGVEYVADSRSMSYVDEVKQWTNDEGVNLIVNMLGGDLAEANKAILAKDGVFVELGKYENREEVHREIRKANPKARIVTVDIDSLWQERPQIIQELFASVIERIDSCDLPFLPYREFPMQNIVEAFRQMASAGHIGKITASKNGFDRQFKGLQYSSTVKQNATYFIAGGTRGFGLATASWLVKHGAQYVVVAGRTPESSNQLKKVTDLAAKAGGTVKAIAADVTDIDSLQGAMDSISKTMPPVRGVFHCAMEIEDSAIINMTRDRFVKSTSSKVLGAWNLYQTTCDFELDFFVLYSSVASVLGPAGQAAYSAANSCLDTFADYLRQEGAPAISINWGAVSDYGHVSDHPNLSTAVDSQFGIDAIPANDMLANLNGLLDCSTNAQVIVAGGVWPNANRTGYVKSSAVHKKTSNGIEGGDKKDLVLDSISKVLVLSKNAIDLDEPIVNLGIDSLLAVELSHLLRTNCQIEVSASTLLDQISINELLENT